MSLKDKLTNFFGLTDEEEAFEEQPAYQQRPAYQRRSQTESVAVNQGNTYVTKQPTRSTTTSQQVQRQAPVSKQPAATTNQRTSQRTEEKVVSMSQSRSATAPKSREIKSKAAGKITIIEPRVYSEAMSIAKQILNGDAVLVNFHLIEEYQARRIVDFLTGTVYAEDGDIKRVGDEIFLCTPKGMEIDGTAQSLADSNLFDI